jgi:hypothetical protein
VVDKEALGQVFSEHFGFLANHSTDFSSIAMIRGWHNRPISGRSAEWNQLDSTPHYTNLKKMAVDREINLLITLSVIGSLMVFTKT